MIHYALGFAFNEAMDYVVLIMKNKPDWQKGNFNGIGGKIEKPEGGLQAMAREFEEETGLSTEPDEWKLVGEMNGPDWLCYIYTMADDELMSARTMEEEEVHVLEVSTVINGDYPFISNVPFLIELCRDRNRPKYSTFNY